MSVMATATEVDSKPVNQWVVDACALVPESILEKSHEAVPGSDVAVLFGCTCDIMENRGGLGNHRLIANGTGTWMVVRTCPLHKDMVK